VTPGVALRPRTQDCLFWTVQLLLLTNVRAISPAARTIITRASLWPFGLLPSGCLADAPRRAAERFQFRRHRRQAADLWSLRGAHSRSLSGGRPSFARVASRLFDVYALMLRPAP
jgi:hypothetical protein